MKKLAARLAKLERQAGLGVWCAWCRLHLLPSPDDLAPAAARTSDPHTLQATCSFCGTRYKVELPPNTDDRMREVLRSVYLCSPDGPYTDARTHALELYFGWVSERRKLRPYLAAPLEDWQDAVADAACQREAHKPKAKGKRRRALEAECDALERAEHKRLLAKYGDRFPELDALVTDLGGAQSDGDSRLAHLRAWAQLETVIWGEPAPETAAELAALGPQSAEELMPPPQSEGGLGLGEGPEEAAGEDSTPSQIGPSPCFIEYVQREQ